MCLLGLNGLRVAEACAADIEDLTGTAYQPMLQVIGKGDRLAEIVLNPRTHQAIDDAIGDRAHGSILVNAWGNRMRRHNVSAMLARHAKADTTVGFDQSAQSFHRDPTFVLMSATAR